jgi:hypothetical protein
MKRGLSTDQLLMLILTAAFFILLSVFLYKNFLHG